MSTLAPRRSLLAAAAGAALLAAGACSKTTNGAARSAEHEEEEDVTPSEDLMREHGALNRVILIYDECAMRLDTGKQLPIDALAKSADIIKRFIEGYHEKLEEDFLFPRFEKANVLADLVGTLRKQHAAGRTVTDTILRLAVPTTTSKDDDRKALVAALRSFTRMYRPHEAREDTVLFPALPRVISEKELHELGEKFEDKEHEMFGKEGFEGVVVQIDAIEKQLGIEDLSQFTPAG